MSHKFFVKAEVAVVEDFFKKELGLSLELFRRHSLITFEELLKVVDYGRMITFKKKCNLVALSIIYTGFSNKQCNVLIY